MAMPQPVEEEEPPTIEEIWEHTPSYPGFQVEIIDGCLVVSPRGNVRHARINYYLHDLFVEIARENGWCLCHELTVRLENNRDRIEPDLVIMPPDAPTFGDREVFGRGVLLVAEVTSRGNAVRDRFTKPRNCALSGMPLYLLVDPVDEPTAVTLFSDPSDDGYRTIERVIAGEKLRLPAPFDFTLDTASLR
ncbi:Uma2 family endonuclease [Actinoallomurus soli]|uniref:Uma2 family endonuclease n=1 Tax=Actinoallomurus soli TaxID=2952535 RepID=UPI0020929231|nr:Uma2 family endonuclease [Actinoallomurus soli]MCO5974434.1 Uma2 family endonuclease [Actinoallomurus soli]